MSAAIDDIAWLLGAVLRLPFVLAGWAWRVLTFGYRHKFTLSGIVTLTFVGAWAETRYGLTWAAVAVAVTAGATGVLLRLWSGLHPVTFNCLVRGPWRHEWIYRPNWQGVMTDIGLGVVKNDTWDTPRLRSVRATRWVDDLVAVLLVGQTPSTFEDKAGEIAHAFGAGACTVQSSQPGTVSLRLRYGDPLAEPIDPVRPDEYPLDAVPIGQTEDGRAWTTPLRGSHLLIAGATGSGKGSVLWSLLWAIGPQLVAGEAVVWAVDPKGGMELSAGSPLFDRFACDDQEQMVTLLEDAVCLLQQRAQTLRGSGRRHEPTAELPLVVVLVDELAWLTSYLNDRDLKKRAGQALSTLLSQGRAVGVSVVAALQDPRKETVPFRDLFPARVALRMTEAEQARMVLGQAAYEAGARCEEIPEWMPGTGYVQRDGIRNPERVRASWIDDSAIDDLVRTVAKLRVERLEEAA